MFFVTDAQQAKQRHEEMIQEAERERRFAGAATVQVDLVANTINMLKAAFARREQARRQAQQAASRRTLTAK